MRSAPLPRRVLVLASLLCLGAAPSPSDPGIPAFPGAEGWGARSIGGRGGRILEVTNLADRGPGSLREAIASRGPRIVVFRVAGYVELEAPLLIEHPYLTIAGQTAPGDGIVLRMKPGNPTGLRGVLGTKRFSRNYAGEVPHDLVIRHIRIRHGRSPTDKKSGGPRPHNFLAYSGYNIIVDHVSSGWTNENLMTLIAPDNDSPPVHDITVQRSFFAESLEGHATGMNVQGQGDAWRRIHRVSLHHNLFAHNSHRNPRSTSGGTEVINNVAYNWSSRIGSTTRGAVIDWIGNYWKPGPMSGGRSLVLRHEDRPWHRMPAYPSEPSIHIAGNVLESRLSDRQADNWPLYVLGYRCNDPLPLRYRRALPLAAPPHPATAQTAEEAYRSVLADVGANVRLDATGRRIANQDAVDTRLLAEVAAGTGPEAVLVSENDVGGFPAIEAGTPYADADHDGMADEWERLHFGDLSRGDPEDSSGDLDADGYTDVEEFLNGTDPAAEEEPRRPRSNSSGPSPR